MEKQEVTKSKFTVPSKEGDTITGTMELLEDDTASFGSVFVLHSTGDDFQIPCGFRYAPCMHTFQKTGKCEWIFYYVPLPVYIDATTGGRVDDMRSKNDPRELIDFDCKYFDLVQTACLSHWSKIVVERDKAKETAKKKSKKSSMNLQVIPGGKG